MSGEVQLKYMVATIMSLSYLVVYSVGSIYILWRFNFKLDKGPKVLMLVCFLYFFIASVSWVFQITCDDYCFDPDQEKGYAFVSGYLMSQIEFAVVIGLVFQVYTVYLFLKTDTQS